MQAIVRDQSDQWTPHPEWHSRAAADTANTYVRLMFNQTLRLALALAPLFSGIALASARRAHDGLHSLARPVALDWMHGCWERRTGPTTIREEWRATATGLDGGTVTVRNDSLLAWEFLRVEPTGRNAGYTAAPNGQPAHTFPLAAAGVDSVRFSDPAHDFPQHITYHRVGGDSLVAVVGAGGAKPRTFTQAMARVACDPARDLTTAVAVRDTLQHMLDSVHALGGAPGLSAAVALPDGRVLTVTSGVADSIGMVPLTSTHRLLAGSTGKTFFAALALQLVAHDSLQLDAKISRWLGDAPWFARLPNGADITVRQLMQHTSGLVRYEFDPAFTRDLARDLLREWTVPEQLAYILGDQAPFAAGAGWEYSDTNYLVLALILEHIIREPAYDAIRTRFLEPLRLRGTVPSDSPRIPGLANGYGASPDPLGLSGPMLVDGSLRVNPKFEWAGGGYASTPEDLARWAQVWYEARAFDSTTLALALDGVPAPMLGRGARYGLGVIVGTSPSGDVFGHSGFFPGYLTEMRYYPRSRLAAVVMANTSDGRALGRSPGSIAHALAERAASAIVAR
jgi:D-alanyl-D-alanine carboxypeptidase